MSEQVTSGRPNRVVDEETQPATHTRSRSSGPIVLIGFILFFAAGALILFAL